MLDYDLAPTTMFKPNTSVGYQERRVVDRHEFDRYEDAIAEAIDLVRQCAESYDIFSQSHALNTFDLEVIDFEPTAISFRDMIDEIRSVFGLNALQLAKLIGVSRATLYNHIKGAEQPKSATAYERLYQTALAVRQVAPQGVSRGLKTVLVDGKTLLSHLKSDYKNASYIANLAEIVMDNLPEERGEKSLSIEQQKSELHSISI